jgi:hypothetical protein
VKRRCFQTFSECRLLIAQGVVNTSLCASMPDLCGISLSNQPTFSDTSNKAEK